MPEPNHTGHGERDKRGAEKGMRDAAMMLEAGNRAAEAPKNIQVGRLGCQSHGQRSVGRPAIEAGAAKACASKEMRDRFHLRA